ncbi:hypothetical protein PR048_024127 [Dryococelus australis]|uniref:DDE Tnp4 domain-containing protein n=1 Tax=Dryococelus australis TaxID=614101 RepID=A0ABQ9GW31_9NEOP|nr:hypothetical protein PR048_024127 [Dryococelus australis]
MFLTIVVRGRGKQSDGGTFIGSTFFTLLEDGSFNLPEDQNLPHSHTTLPNVLIGDETYPLKPYLMRSYTNNYLTPRNQNFNTRLSTAV